MKIKQSPDDFRVEELTDATPSAGDYALYRLEKSGWTTTDALAIIRRRWRIPPDRISIGGMKDRHAQTVQFMTIHRGPRRGMSQQNIRVSYVGQIPDPYTSAQIRSNRFEIAIRSLSEQESETMQQWLPDVARDGLPNYFDDQRFGSIAGGSGEFVAHHLIRGDYEQALRLALTGEYGHDRAAARREKSILRKHWGDWGTCKQKLARSQHSIELNYLADRPDDFRGAFTRLRDDLKVLHLSVFQSHLWNRCLTTWIEGHCSTERFVPIDLKLGGVNFVVGIDDSQRAELSRLALPLPSARLHYEDVVANAPEDWPAAMRSVLTEYGLELADMRLPGLRRPFFSRGERPIWFWPIELTAAVHPDERAANRRKLVLSFELPRGSYATLVIKRLTQRPAAISEVTRRPAD